MQFLARLEAHCLARSDAHFGACAWVAANASFAGADAEYAKSAKFDALSGGQGLLKALEDRIHRSFCLRARQARALDYLMDDVLFNQSGILAGGTAMTVLLPTREMVQKLPRLWNTRMRMSPFL
jgi:hypothetical protein